MSKMGQHMIREAESRSLENAAEVERLRAEVRRLEATIRRVRAAMEECGKDLARFDGNRARAGIGWIIAEAVRELADAIEPEQDAEG